MAPPEVPKRSTTSLEESVAFFSAHPWTGPLVSAAAAEGQAIFSPPNRLVKATNEDALFSKTLASGTTITHALALHPVPEDARGQHHLERCTTLLHLGSGMDGWAGMLHGGIVATLHDECTGVLLQSEGRLRRRRREQGGGAPGGDHQLLLPHPSLVEPFTIRLDVRYLAPVRTPGIVKVVVSVTARKGRWIALLAEMFQCGEGGGEDVLCSTGAAEFVGRKPAAAAGKL